MRRRVEGLGTIRTEGGLLSRDLLERVAAGDKTLAGMAPEGYHLAPNEKLGEAITRSWNRLVGAWESFSDIVANLPTDERTATTITRQRWTLLLFQELGFGQLQTTKAVDVDGRSYPVSHAWTHVPIHLVGVRVDLDRRTPGVAGAATMSPHSLVQELLNRTDEHLWAIVTNGLRLRLLRDNVALTRQAYVEFDLEAMFTGQAYADFALLWLVCHQSRFEADIPAKCLLEQWTLEADERGTRALDQLRVGVEAAITALGEGFLAHPANAQLRHSLEAGELDKQDYYRQLLRTVYRLLFLFVAEGRDLLLDPSADTIARERYRSFYSLSRLRALADARRGTTHGDQWAGLQLVMHALGENGEPALGLPGLGSFLWKSQATPDLDGARLDNRRLLTAIRSLSMTAEGGVTRSVDYRNLGAEELGSIYESLLELHPVVDVTARTFALSTAGGNERKTTGSYYTPTSLITELLDSALEPVLDEAASAADPEAALLGVTVLDPACGSGHFLIAAAHRIAKRLASVRSGDGEPAPPLVQEALREVVATCIHGIDVNEMAVELCKVSLWMEAMVPGKPLAFLEHRIVCGNALLGATPRLLSSGIPDEAFKPLTGDDKAVVTALRRSNKQQRESANSGQGTLAFGASVAGLQAPLRAGLAEIDAIDDDTVAGIASKERHWTDLQALPVAHRAQLAADAWCAAFVAPKRAGEPAITDAVVRAIERSDAVEADVLGVVGALSRQYGFLHPHLAFAGVFRVSENLDAGGEGAGWEGGFSVVLGNPPWERVKASGEGVLRGQHAGDRLGIECSSSEELIAALIDDDPVLFESFQAAVRQSEGESGFLRVSGRYPLCGRGDVNTYTVFAEAMRSAVDPEGRVGVIVPTGIATDETTKFFFADLVATRSLVSLFDFQNVDIFPGVGHGVMHFCLLTLAGVGHGPTAIDFVFFAKKVIDLADDQRHYVLKMDDFRLFNPNSLTCPTFRSRRDADITKAIYLRSAGIQRSESEFADWQFSYVRLVDYEDHSDQLLTPSWSTDFVSVYEAKMIHAYDHRWAEYVDGHIRSVPDELKRDPSFRPMPRYSMQREQYDAILAGRGYDQGFHLCFREVARSTDERTIIACLLPPVAAFRKLPVIKVGSPERVATMLGLWNSFVFDFVARQKHAGISISLSVFWQLPLPDAVVRDHPIAWLDDSAPIASWITPRVLELTYTSWELWGFAAALGSSSAPVRWEGSRRALLRAELDACFFHVWGIERDGVDYIMDTFPIVRRRDEAAFGEYRTKRLVLGVYDAIEEAKASGKPYQTILDPPPADPSLCHPESTRPDWATQT